MRPLQSRNIPLLSTAPDSDTQEDDQHEVTPPNDTEHPKISKQEAHEGGNMLIVKLLVLAVPTSDSQHNVPTHYKDIACLPVQQQLQWRAACREELEALQKRQVYELVNLPLNCKVIGNRWVLNQKMDGRKRARLVAKGYSQVKGIDYSEIFSPVIRYESIRLMFTLAALENWYITGLDVKTAFLYGKLNEEIYMKQPKGFTA